MLDLQVACHKDRSLEVSWGVHCDEWLGRGPTQVRTTPRVLFRAMLRDRMSTTLDVVLQS
jgi:hypothetical protein